MAKSRETKPPLTLVGPGTDAHASPPRKLGKHGLSLWNAVMTEYRIEDRGGIELLAQCCASLDRAESLAAQIDADGQVIRTRNGPKAHPALRDELANRAFICRTLERLGLNVESVKAVGRPAGGLGWRGNAD